MYKIAATICTVNNLYYCVIFCYKIFPATMKVDLDNFLQNL